MIELKGRAHKHMMYLDDYDPLDINVESLSVEQAPTVEESGRIK